MIRPWAWRRRSARLARAVPPHSVSMVLGDLLEEFADRQVRHGRVRAEWWLWRECAALRRAYRDTGLAPARGRAAAWLPRPSDLVQGARLLRRAPWYTMTVAAVLALGLSLSTTVFAIVDGALFKPLPYPGVDRLFATAMGYARLQEPLRTFPVVAPADVDRWRHVLPDFAFTAYAIGDLQTIGTHETARSARVDAVFFDVLGLRPAIGGFAAADFSGAGPIRPAILSDALWRTRFGGDRAVIGKTFVDSAETGNGIRVAGVLPPGFVFPFADGVSFTPRLLTPLPDTPASTGRNNYVLVRLPENSSAGAASARFNAVVGTDAAARPPAAVAAGVSERQRILRAGYDEGGLVPIRSALTERLTQSSWMIFAAAGCLVLLGCLNVSALAITRFGDRRRELAVRVALGARGADLVRLLAAETTLVAGAGAILGLIVARLALPFTTQLLTGFLLVLKPAVIDWRVATYAASACVTCALLTTLLSARAATRAAGRATLADGGSVSRRERRARVLLSIEIALAFVVAVGGALVAGSLMRVWAEDPGFDIRHTAVIGMSAPRGASAAEITRLIQDIERVPGVARAGGVAHALLDRAFNGSVFDAPPGIADPEGGNVAGSFPIESIPVTRGYFEAAGLRVLDGRLPTDDELSRGDAVLAVSDRVARLYWPGRRPLGETLLNRGRAFTVVGIVPDARFMALDAEPQGEIYWPVAASPSPSTSNVLLRLDDGASLGAVTAAVIRGCPKCWVRRSQMLRDAMGVTIRQRQFSAWLFSAFGVSALVIVGSGVFGLVAMTTRRRTREIGIRIALGASRRVVLAQIVREQLLAVGVGVAAGGAVAAWLTRFLTASLYKTEVYDVAAWTAAAGALLLVALTGAVIPSRRACRIDPVRALRVD